MGARYKGYCANLSRSILVNPTAGQRKAYETLLAQTILPFLAA